MWGDVWLHRTVFLNHASNTPDPVKFSVHAEVIIESCPFPLAAVLHNPARFSKKLELPEMLHNPRLPVVTMLPGVYFV